MKPLPGRDAGRWRFGSSSATSTGAGARSSCSSTRPATSFTCGGPAARGGELRGVSRFPDSDWLEILVAGPDPEQFHADLGRDLQFDFSRYSGPPEGSTASLPWAM